MAHYMYLTPVNDPVNLEIPRLPRFLAELGVRGPLPKTGGVVLGVTELPPDFFLPPELYKHQMKFLFYNGISDFENFGIFKITYHTTPRRSLSSSAAFGSSF